MAGTNYRPMRNWNNPTRHTSVEKLLLVAPRNDRKNSRHTKNMESYKPLVLKRQHTKQRLSSTPRSQQGSNKAAHKAASKAERKAARTASSFLLLSLISNSSETCILVNN
jgi:hypothetical protein